MIFVENTKLVIFYTVIVVSNVSWKRKKFNKKKRPNREKERERKKKRNSNSDRKSGKSQLMKFPVISRRQLPSISGRLWWPESAEASTSKGVVGRRVTGRYLSREGSRSLSPRDQREGYVVLSASLANHDRIVDRISGTPIALERTTQGVTRRVAASHAQQSHAN